MCKPTLTGIAIYARVAVDTAVGITAVCDIGATFIATMHRTPNAQAIKSNR
jgi:hypothetical protein